MALYFPETLEVVSFKFATCAYEVARRTHLHRTDQYRKLKQAMASRHAFVEDVDVMGTRMSGSPDLMNVAGMDLGPAESLRTSLNYCLQGAVGYTYHVVVPTGQAPIKTVEARSLCLGDHVCCPNATNEALISGTRATMEATAHTCKRASIAGAYLRSAYWTSISPEALPRVWPSVRRCLPRSTPAHPKLVHPRMWRCMNPDDGVRKCAFTADSEY